MSTGLSATQIVCEECSAPLSIEQGSNFVVCEYCQTTNFVDKSRAVFHYAVRPTVRENDAVAALRRWMAGNATIKDLDQKADIGRPVLELFPMWLVRAQHGGSERVFLEPAAALSISELKHMTVPAGDLEPYDHEMDEAATAPTVPYDTMVKWLADDEGVPAGAIREASIVHLPIYVVKYTYDGERYTAVVDAASSQVFANIFPAKWEVPYVAIGALAFAVYFCAALIPAGGYVYGDVEGLGFGLLAYCVIGVVLAVPVFAAAAYVSSKV